MLQTDRYTSAVYVQAGLPLIANVSPEPSSQLQQVDIISLREFHFHLEPVKE